MDYPGKVAATVFLCGCNFRCPFCHNPELADPNGFNKEFRISSEEVLDFLESRKNKLDGVCITGGEPTLCPELPDFIGKIREMGFLVKLDTNGTNPEMLAFLLEEGLLDYVAMDIKAPLDKKKYARAVGISSSGRESAKSILSKVKKSVKILMQSDIDYEFRTTLVKGLHSKEDVLEIARSIKGAKKFYLQAFVPGDKILDPEYRKKKPFSSQEMHKMADECEQFVEHCEVRE